MHQNIESPGFTSRGGIPLKTGIATQCPHTSLLGGDVTTQNIESLGFTSRGGIPLKTDIASQCRQTPLHVGDVTNQSHQIMPVAYSDQNQGRRPNHPKRSQPLSPSGEHIGTTLGLTLGSAIPTGIRNPYPSIPPPLLGEVTVCH